MLHFLIGRAGTGKTSRIREEAARVIAESEMPVVILVPEQQTVAWETEMARRLPPSANLRLEITNFTRLADSVFREYGGLADPVVDEGIRMLVVWRAMLSVREQLSVYGHVSRNAGATGAGAGREDRNLPALTRAVDELKASGITPAMAEEALARLESLEEERGNGQEQSPSGDLLSRLRDAVLVYAAYEEILHRDSIDRGDLPALLADKLQTHPYFRGKAVFVDSFYSLTAPQEKILSEIFSQAEEVWVSFACPPPSSADLAGDERQFSEIRAFFKTAVRLADRCGKPFERICLTENLRHKNAPTLRRIEAGLFRYARCAEDAKPDGGADGTREGGDSVTILRCADLYDEAQACASVIGRLLREGYACREIAVVARSFAGREGITDAALREQGIPCFLSESSAVSRSPAVRFVEAALAVGAGGWQRRDVIRFVKTGLTPASDPDTDPDADGDGGGLSTFAEEAFESYTAVWNIRGRRMFTGDDWTMNPAGYRPELTEEGRAILCAANGVRRRVLGPLARFLSVFDDPDRPEPKPDGGRSGRAGTADVRRIAEGIVLLAEECGLEERLLRLAGTYREIGMPKEGARTEAGWDAVCRILDKMTAVLGDSALDAGRFAGQFSRVAASMDAGTIPTGCDEVVLGSASGVRFDEVRCVILLGTVEGEFPGTSVSAGDFFDDRDKLALESVGLVISGPDASMQAAREAFMFYRAAASAGEKLVLLAPTGNGGGGGKELSEGAARIAALSGAPVRTYGELPIEEIVWHPAAAEYQLARRTSEEDRAVLKRIAGRAGSAPVPLTAENDRISAPMRETARRMRLSQSRIETFLSCPFRFACRFRMKLAEEPRAEITAADVGNFVHHVLERYFASCSPDLPEEEMREAAREIIAEYVEELSRMTRARTSPANRADARGSQIPDGRLVYLFRRLERHTLVFLRAVSKELSQGGFRPAAFELPIGLGPRDRAVEPIRIRTAPGTPYEAEVTLDGIADRVDLWNAPDGKQYIRVVDYKTGSKPFSLDRVRRGLDVQALLYLFAVWKNGLPKPKRSDPPAPASQDEPERVPAAAVYFTVRPAPVQSARMLTAGEAEAMAEEQLGRVGVYLGDEAALRAMDSDLSGRFVPVKETKDGGFVGRGKTELLTLEEFGALYEEIGETVGRIAGAMRSGEAGAKPRRTPAEDPCAYCANRFICRVV